MCVIINYMYLLYSKLKFPAEVSWVLEKSKSFQVGNYRARADLVLTPGHFLLISAPLAPWLWGQSLSPQPSPPEQSETRWELPPRELPPQMNSAAISVSISGFVDWISSISGYYFLPWMKQLRMFVNEINREPGRANFLFADKYEE